MLRPPSTHSRTPSVSSDGATLRDEPPAAPEDVPRIVERQNNWNGRFKDWAHRVRNERVLCSVCTMIPFSACLRSNSDLSKFLYLTDLDHIVSNEKSCPFCELILACLSKPENDIFLSAHIKDHLGSSKDLQAFKTSHGERGWLNWYCSSSILDRKKEASWPFGHTRDPEEAQRAIERAKDLFLSAEERDVHAKISLGGLASGSNIVGDTARVASLGMGIVDTAKPGALGRGGAGVRLVTNELSEFAARANRVKIRLPCYFVVRVYGHNESKAGAISIRGFAFGRGPRAPANEICHFSLRGENSQGLRISEAGQMWYGRSLQADGVDFELLRKCLETCQTHREHQKSCWTPPWNVPEHSTEQHIFRLVDLINGSVVEKVNGTVPYVALSYVWGTDSWNDDQIVLSPSTLHSLSEVGGVTRQHLRPTIRHAMEVARRMGSDYLWVDKLCVMQSDPDPNQAEQSISLGLMDIIYSKALFTIVDGSSDLEEGLLKSRKVADQITSEIDRNVKLFHPAEIHQDLSRWESRAWTFQEKVPSRRMLVFSGGFAVWQCQVGTWREDVNARDCNERDLAVSRSYLQPVREYARSAAKHGFEESDLDGSMRIYRRSAFRQYAKCVHDYTNRAMGRPEDMLNACLGILNVLGLNSLMSTKYSNGLPLKYMDAALLWQPQYKITRRKTARETFPSWSWAGWQLDDSSSKKRHKSLKQTEGPSVFYRSTFNIFSDEQGINFRLSKNEDQDGEERLRPWATYYIFESKSSSGEMGLRRVGLLNAPWLNRNRFPLYPDWEARGVTAAPVISVPAPQNRYLVVCTEEATLCVCRGFFEGRRYTAESDAACVDIEFDVLGIGDDDARERSLFSSETSDEIIGAATCSIWPSRSTIKRIAVKAIVLSEAQYLGNENRPDVLGYPLYNIMLITSSGGIAERIGLGKVLKSAWKRASPQQKTIVLG